MPINNRFIRVHQDAIVEWIWDDNFFYSDNYSIIDDANNNVSSFTFSNDAQDPNNYNKLPFQLYLIDEVINKFGVMNPSQKNFLQERKFVNPSNTEFNKVKIWFPINYTFNTNTGFYLRTYGLNFQNAVEYNLSNYFLDITEPGELSKITEESVPFRYGDRLWGKSIELYVPSLYDEALKRTNNAPTIGSINERLTNGILGLSQTSPIFIDFRFLQSKSQILGERTYITTPKRIVSIPQAPEYNNLSVQIKPASDGDYFEINGLYNGTIGGFNNFMNSLEQSNSSSYILYSITVFEENIPQDTRDIYVYKDFFKGVNDYIPVLKFTNTTATIRVDMKLINSVNNSVVTKSTEYTIIGNEVAKYSKNRSFINVSNTIKPKLYNSKPDTLIIPNKDLLETHFRKVKNKKTDEIKFVPFPILTNVYNIVAQEATVVTDEQEYLGLGELILKLTPFDNVIKINLYKQQSDDEMIPFEIPSSNSIIQLVFKSSSKEVRVPLYKESNEVNLQNGTVVFKIPPSEQNDIRNIQNSNNTFYITITTNGVETNLYDGKFQLLLTEPRINNEAIKRVRKRRIPQIDNLINVESLIPIQRPQATIPIESVSIQRNSFRSITSKTLNVNQLKRIL